MKKQLLFRFLKLLFSGNGWSRIQYELITYTFIPIEFWKNCEFRYNKTTDCFMIDLDDTVRMSFSIRNNEHKLIALVDGRVTSSKELTMSEMLDEVSQTFHNAAKQTNTKLHYLI